MQENNSFSGWRRLLRVTATTAAVAAVTATTAMGCLDRPIEPVEPRTTSTIVERLTQSAVDKIDLLLVIDNSRSMADKQEILNLAIPDLVNQLVNPYCVDDSGMRLPDAQQPADPLAECPPASQREFDPILDIHIGVITTSLGGHGADSCNGNGSATENDHGYLITRSSADGSTPPVETWNNKGFLVWDPDTMDPSHSPQGQTDIAALNADVQALVGGAGEVGCGYEAQLESWYRFLIDPDPYQDIALENNSAILQGTDNDLLQMRTAFLRPDSLLAIIMLSDENDCSIRDGGQFYFAGQIYQPGTNNPYHLPPARAACASNPNDPCCRSCGQGPGDGCDASADMCGGALPALEDNINLRCWDMKRRFGIEFLWPIDRYVSGLTSPQVSDRNGNVVSNPLYRDLDLTDTNNAVRDPGLVFVAGIVGVPWQDIARKNAAGQPDLLTGLNAEGEEVGGFQSGAELALNATFDLILGDPSCYHTDANCLPDDPLMVEDVSPRTGTHPITGETPAPASDPLGNQINGHEYGIPNKDDLQYACIFDLATPRDCTMASTNCDCTDANNDNPLCYNAGFGTTQYRAKAYPGVRELQLLKAVGTQGIVGSICPAQQSDDTLFNFGYRPAVGAIVERLKQALGGQCLSRSLTPDALGQVSCIILEARIAPDCQAVCSAAGRRPIDQNDPAVTAAKDDPITQNADGTERYDCYCEIPQLDNGDPNSNADDNLFACQTDVSETPVNGGGGAVDGWCYIDATTAPPVGNVELVENCPENEERIIRFVGAGAATAGATLFITCTGE
jgi:hypothetical protein